MVLVVLAGMVSVVLAGMVLEDSGAALELASGTEMGTPAETQVFLTPEMTAAWSSALHDSCTQGVTEASRASDFSQWHLKSVSSEQPSEPNAVKKH
jgi:hypothetical protein